MRYLVELDGRRAGGRLRRDVPDLPGCTSARDDLGEALRNAKEAISLHIEAMIADGEPVPAPGIEPAPPSASRHQCRSPIVARPAEALLGKRFEELVGDAA